MYNIEELDIFLKRNPQKTKEVFEILSNNIEEYKKSVELNRNGIATSALINIVPFCLESKTFLGSSSIFKIAVLIDAMFYLFPDGRETIHSKFEREVFNIFKTICRDENILNDNWLKEIKGKEYYEWMKKVIGGE